MVTLGFWMALAALSATDSRTGSGVPDARSIPNWEVPATWTPPRPAGALQTMTDASPAIPFVAITPCRIADTRGLGFSGQAGPPALSANVSRAFQVTGTVAGIPTQCGIPAGADAVSFQFTIVTPSSDGNLIAWPGGPAPSVSVLNWEAGTVALGNGTIVPVSVGGAVTIQVNAAGGATAHLVVDVNGYFSDTFNPVQIFRLIGAVNDGLITAENSSTGGNAQGLRGVLTSTGATGASAAVRGVHGGTGSSGVGVWGSHAGTGWGVFGEAGGRGVFGLSSAGTGVVGFSTSGAGVEATSLEGTAVVGHTESADVFAAGLYGDATQATANGGLFRNFGSGSGATVFLATGIAPEDDWALDTGGYLRAFGAQIADIVAAYRFVGQNLSICCGTKNFVSPHPEDPELEIAYASVEAPTVDVYFRGTAHLVGGAAWIAVPDHFRFTAREGTYMTTLTAVGPPVALGVVEEGPEGIVVRGEGDAKFHYVVYAERAEIEGARPVRRNVHFTPEALAGRASFRLETLPKTTRALLVKNGTLNPDGTFNEETAKRLGWKIPAPRTEKTSLSK